MVEQQALAGWASMTPGPELGMLLDGVDLAAVGGEELVGVLQASWRQLSHGHALYLAAMVEVGRRERVEASRAAELSRAAGRAGARSAHGVAASAADAGAPAETELGRGSVAWAEQAVVAPILVAPLTVRLVAPLSRLVTTPVPIHRGPRGHRQRGAAVLSATNDTPVVHMTSRPSTTAESGWCHRAVVPRLDGMGMGMPLRAGPDAVLTVVAFAFAFALAGGLAGIGIRVLLGRLRRGAQVRRGGCEAALAMLWWAAGAGWLTGLIPDARLPLLLGLGWLAVAAGSVDLLHRRLPDALTGPAVPLALLLLAPLGPAAVGRGLAGGALAFTVYAVVHLLSPADLGAGDVKLASSLGAVLAGLSWSAMAVAAVLAALLTAAVALATITRTLIARTTIARIAVARTRNTRGATTRSATARGAVARAPPDLPEHRSRRTVPHGPSMLAATWLVAWLTY